MRAKVSPKTAPLACPICKGPVGLALTYSSKKLSVLSSPLENSFGFCKALFASSFKKVFDNLKFKYPLSASTLSK